MITAAAPRGTPILARRVAVVVVMGASALVAAACSEDREIDRSALTTTTSFAPMPSVAQPEDLQNLPVPDDDGGVLCDAVLAWVSAEGPDPVGGAGPLGDALATSADAFEASVVPQAPASLRSDANSFLASLRAAASELKALRGDSRDLGQLMLDGELDAYEAYLRLILPTAYDPAATEWANEFMAWIASPCGPKPVSLAWEPVPTTSVFD
ncbi:MAG: hypothetical protein M9952_07255 [Microthrixaceae bacterium]|nr:hypothetical protein [Microthrixaceae bacterium]